MLLLSRLDPYRSRRFRQFFAMLGGCGKTLSGWLTARATSPERERAPPHRAGLLKSLQDTARVASVALTCDLPESETISLTWKKRRPCGVPSSLLAPASRLSSRYPPYVTMSPTWVRNPLFSGTGINRCIVPSFSVSLYPS